MPSYNDYTLSVHIQRHPGIPRGGEAGFLRRSRLSRNILALLDFLLRDLRHGDVIFLRQVRDLLLCDGFIIHLARPERPDLLEGENRGLGVHELVSRTKSLAEYVAHASVVEDDADWAAGDDAGSLGCREHADACGLELHFDFVRERALHERDADHVAARGLHSLANRDLHFVRLPRAETDFALAITYDNDRAETHAASAFHDAGHAIDGERRLGELGRLAVTVSA